MKKKKTFIPVTSGMKSKISKNVDLSALEFLDTKGMRTRNYNKPDFDPKYPFRIVNDDYWTMIYNLGFAVKF